MRNAPALLLATVVALAAPLIGQVPQIPPALAQAPAIDLSGYSGHGYLSDEHEVLEYRDMVVIVRDGVKAMIDAGATLAQVKAARVTADYDTQYGANTGPWTTEMFVEAVFNSLKASAPGR